MENEENKLYFSSNLALSMLYAQKDMIEETGISFNGNAKIDDDISIYTDKEIKIDGLENTHKTYLKVMEMRDLNEDEMKYASKARRLLNKAFEILFHNKKALIAWTLFLCTTLGIDIATDNFLGIILKSICILFVNRPIKFVKEALKIFNSDKKREELAEYLRENHVLGYVDSVDDRNDIKMYAKLR